MTAERVRDYFNSWAREYGDAVTGSSAHGNSLQSLINRLFRKQTFAARNAQLIQVLESMDLAGKSILDVGCGIGNLSHYCAGQGAEVTGLDISANMLELARERADQLGSVSGRVRFEIGDFANQALGQYDMVLCIAVLEYYEKGEVLARKLSASAGQDLLICLPRAKAWRRGLRKLLGRFKGFPVYYHHAERIIAAAEDEGMQCMGNWPAHSFQTLLFRRTRTEVVE